MARVNLSPGLIDEYTNLFNTCIINPARTGDVEKIIQKILANKQRYETVGSQLNIPWYFIAVIHNMESSLDFSRHLHNGDPLIAKTVHVPAGRPKTGTPPFTWEESAADALQMMNLHKWDDWSIGGMLYKIEEYNGWGYRLHHQHVLSPYLWSFSNKYLRGKYIADGRWSDTAVSSQCGAAVLLRRLAEKGEITFNGKALTAEIQITPVESVPLVRFSNKKIPYAEELQKYLNTIPGIFVKVDGIPGNKTSEAFKKVTGYYLFGDERIV